VLAAVVSFIVVFLYCVCALFVCNVCYLFVVLLYYCQRVNAQLQFNTDIYIYIYISNSMFIVLKQEKIESEGSDDDVYHSESLDT
jgi:hypothetical protein